VCVSDFQQYSTLEDVATSQHTYCSPANFCDSNTPCWR